jgi:dipicolinate synthase subunit A
LIIGWGRIGKCLTRIFRGLEADLTIVARKGNDRAMAKALGYTAIDFEELRHGIDRYRLIINTVPASVLDCDLTAECMPGCLLMDLASVQGIDAPNVLWARGLPGRDAPEASGALIARSTIRLLDRREQP